MSLDSGTGRESLTLNSLNSSESNGEENEDWGFADKDDQDFDFAGALSKRKVLSGPLASPSRMKSPNPANPVKLSHHFNSLSLNKSPGLGLPITNPINRKNENTSPQPSQQNNNNYTISPSPRSNLNQNKFSYTYEYPSQNNNNNEPTIAVDPSSPFPSNRSSGLNLNSSLSHNADQEAHSAAEYNDNTHSNNHNHNKINSLSLSPSLNNSSLSIHSPIYTPANTYHHHQNNSHSNNNNNNNNNNNGSSPSIIHTWSFSEYSSSFSSDPNKHVDNNDVNNGKDNSKEDDNDKEKNEAEVLRSLIAQRHQRAMTFSNLTKDNSSIKPTFNTNNNKITSNINNNHSNKNFIRPRLSSTPTTNKPAGNNNNNANNPIKSDERNKLSSDVGVDEASASRKSVDKNLFSPVSGVQNENDNTPVTFLGQNNLEEEVQVENENEPSNAENEEGEEEEEDWDLALEEEEAAEAQRLFNLNQQFYQLGSYNINSNNPVTHSNNINPSNPQLSSSGIPLHIALSRPSHLSMNMSKQKGYNTMNFPSHNDNGNPAAHYFPSNSTPNSPLPTLTPNLLSFHSSSINTPTNSNISNNQSLRSMSIDRDARALGISTSHFQRLSLPLLYTEILSFFISLSNRYRILLSTIQQSPLTLYEQLCESIVKNNNVTKTDSLRSDFAKNMATATKEISILKNFMQKKEEELKHSRLNSPESYKVSDNDTPSNALELEKNGFSEFSNLPNYSTIRSSLISLPSLHINSHNLPDPPHKCYLSCLIGYAPIALSFLYVRYMRMQYYYYIMHQVCIGFDHHQSYQRKISNGGSVNTSNNNNLSDDSNNPNLNHINNNTFTGTINLGLPGTPLMNSLFSTKVIKKSDDSGIQFNSLHPNSINNNNNNGNSPHSNSLSSPVTPLSPPLPFPNISMNNQMNPHLLAASFSHLVALPTTNSNLEGLRVLNLILQAIDFLVDNEGGSKQSSARLSLAFQRLSNTLLDKFEIQDPRWKQ